MKQAEKHWSGPDSRDPSHFDKQTKPRFPCRCLVPGNKAGYERRGQGLTIDKKTGKVYGVFDNTICVSPGLCGQ